jgi:hypothetical protein
MGACAQAYMMALSRDVTVTRIYQAAMPSGQTLI